MTAQRLLTEENPEGDITINDIDMAVYSSYLNIFAPLVEPLEHIYTKVENMSVGICKRRRRVSSTIAVGPLLREEEWICLQTQTHISVAQIVGMYNKEADDVTWLTHLTIS